MTVPRNVSRRADPVAAIEGLPGERGQRVAARRDVLAGGGRPGAGIGTVRKADRVRSRRRSCQLTRFLDQTILLRQPSGLAPYDGVL